MFEVVFTSILATYFVLLVASYFLKRIVHQTADQESI